MSHSHKKKRNAKNNQIKSNEVVRSGYCVKDAIDWGGNGERVVMEGDVVKMAGWRNNQFKEMRCPLCTHACHMQKNKDIALSIASI